MSYLTQIGLHKAQPVSVLLKHLHLPSGINSYISFNLI